MEDVECAAPMLPHAATPLGEITYVSGWPVVPNPRPALPLGSNATCKARSEMHRRHRALCLTCNRDWRASEPNPTVNGLSIYSGDICGCRDLSE